MNENETVENEAVETEVVETTQETQETPQGTTKITRNRVPRDEFIEAWEEVALGDNPSVQKVADRLGLEKTSVQQRSMKYRRENGIMLTKMPRGGGATFDAEGAKKYLEEVRARIAAKKAAEAAEANADAETEDLTETEVE